MLTKKLWGMWSKPWFGGNSTLHPDTSRLQHVLFAGLAFLGLIGGVLYTSRWSLVTVTAGVAAITFLNVINNGQGRDNLRLMPLVFTYGAVGLVVLLRRFRSS